MNIKKSISTLVLCLVASAAYSQTTSQNILGQETARAWINGHQAPQLIDGDTVNLNWTGAGDWPHLNQYLETRVNWGGRSRTVKTIVFHFNKDNLPSSLSIATYNFSGESLSHDMVTPNNQLTYTHTLPQAVNANRIDIITTGAEFYTSHSSILEIEAYSDAGPAPAPTPAPVPPAPPAPPAEPNAKLGNSAIYYIASNGYTYASTYPELNDGDRYQRDWDKESWYAGYQLPAYQVDFSDSADQTFNHVTVFFRDGHILENFNIHTGHQYGNSAKTVEVRGNKKAAYHHTFNGPITARSVWVEAFEKDWGAPAVSEIELLNK